MHSGHITAADGFRKSLPCFFPGLSQGRAHRTPGAAAVHLGQTRSREVPRLVRLPAGRAASGNSSDLTRLKHPHHSCASAQEVQQGHRDAHRATCPGQGWGKSELRRWGRWEGGESK